MLICLEGVAGAGKTTQASLMARHLSNSSNQDVLVSAAYEDYRRESAAEFMSSLGINLDDNATMFLFQALHAIQYKEVKDALSSNKIVIADRWRYSFFAHHVYANTFGNNELLMNEIDNFAYRDLYPDVCILIDLPAKLAWDRYISRETSAGEKGGLQLMDITYFEAVTDYYRGIARGPLWHVVDGSKTEQEVFLDIKNIVDMVA